MTEFARPRPNQETQHGNIDSHHQDGELPQHHRIGEQLGHVALVQDELPEEPEVRGFEDRDYGGRASNYTRRKFEKNYIAGRLENGLFGGYTPITRHTGSFDKVINFRSFNDGAQTGYGAESVYIDLAKDAGGYEYTRSYLHRKITSDPVIGTLPNGSYDLPERAALQMVFATIKETTTYDDGFQVIDKIKAQAFKNDPKYARVPLARYLAQNDYEKGVGVCRHMALACAWLGWESAENNTFNLTGTFSDRANIIDEVGGHGWGRYDSKVVDGEAFIMDVAQDFFGTLDEVYEKYANSKSKGERTKLWDYFTDEAEFNRYRVRYETRMAEKGHDPQRVARQNQRLARDPNAPVMPEYFNKPENQGPDRKDFYKKNFVNSVQAIMNRSSRREDLPSEYSTFIDLNTTEPLVSAQSAKEFFNLRGPVYATLMLGKQLAFVVGSETFSINRGLTTQQPVDLTPRGERRTPETAVNYPYALAVITETELEDGYLRAHGKTPYKRDTNGYFAIAANTPTVVGRSNTNNPAAIFEGPEGIRTNNRVSKKHAILQLTHTWDTCTLMIQDAMSKNGTVVFSRK